MRWLLALGGHLLFTLSVVLGAKTLVLLPNVESEATYSDFLSSLKDAGHSLTFHSGKPELFQYGSRVYDNIVSLHSSISSFGGTLSVGQLLDFVNAGGNLLLSADSSLSEAIRDFAIEFSVDFDEPGTGVLDPFHSLSAEEADVILASEWVKNGHIVSEKVWNGPPVLFKGVAHKLSGKNSLVFPLLTGAASAYSYDLEDESLIGGLPILGQSIGLVSAFQGRNNARIVFCGSTDLFSNTFLKKKVKIGSNTVTSGNKEFVKQLSEWVFQLKGVLKLENPKHYHVNDTLKQQHGIYRIKDDLVFSVDISEYKGGEWVPAHLQDAQFEVVMLDPYIRMPLSPPKASSSPTHSAVFKLPDHYGVFTFKIDYARHGLSFIAHSETVQVRPYRHDQYPRFLTVAFPYYTAAFSMMGSFLVVCAVFLFYRETTKIKEN